MAAFSPAPRSIFRTLPVQHARPLIFRGRIYRPSFLHHHSRPPVTRRHLIRHRQQRPPSTQPRQATLRHRQLRLARLCLTPIRPVLTPARLHQRSKDRPRFPLRSFQVGCPMRMDRRAPACSVVCSMARPPAARPASVLETQASARQATEPQASGHQVMAIRGRAIRDWAISLRHSLRKLIQREVRTHCFQEDCSQAARLAALRAELTTRIACSKGQDFGMVGFAMATVVIHLK